MDSGEREQEAWRHADEQHNTRQAAVLVKALVFAQNTVRLHNYGLR
jgi:hypothetical protein